MKKNLLIERMMIVALAGCALTACSKREEAPSAPTAPLPQAVPVSVEDGNYRVYKHCVDGISHLTFANHTIIMQRDKNDKPVTCVQPAEPSVR